jgi:ABC-type sugar transport system ATPase subunit
MRFPPVTALSITALAKSFHAGTPKCSARVSVLRGLDFAMWPGEVVALEGASGSGRTTLLRCAAGLLRADAGAIVWFGARVAPRDAVAYVSATPALRSGETTAGSIVRGALYAALEMELARRTRLLLIDDLPTVGALERRLVLDLVRRYSLTGAAILLTASEELATLSWVSRTVTLSHGALTQRRNRSAARIASSSRASRARASARSTYGRSFRSPQ